MGWAWLAGRNLACLTSPLGLARSGAPFLTRVARRPSAHLGLPCSASPGLPYGPARPTAASSLSASSRLDWAAPRPKAGICLPLRLFPPRASPVRRSVAEAPPCDGACRRRHQRADVPTLLLCSTRLRRAASSPWFEGCAVASLASARGASRAAAVTRPGTGDVRGAVGSGLLD